MKNWHTLEADRVLLMQKHFTLGRGGHTIDRVVVHHNAGVLSIDDIWNVWQQRAASAHYQVTSWGEIGQLVWDQNTAWHAAHALANQRSIGIEISNSGGAAQGWPITVKALEEASHLIAAICVFYKLGRPVWGKNVFGHSDYYATSCPHHMARGGKYHNTLMSRAQYWYDAMTSGNTTNTGGTSTVTPEQMAQIQRWIQAEAAATRKFTADFVTGFTGPIGSDVKDVREQLTGGRNAGEYGGWPQLGDQTLVNALADVRNAVTAPTPSLINPNVSLTPRNLLRLVDATVWRIERVIEAQDGAKKLIATAIAEDNAPKKEESQNV